MSAPLTMCNVRYFAPDRLPEQYATQWVHNPNYHTSLIRKKDGTFGRICNCRGYLRWQTSCKHLEALEDWVQHQERKRQQKEVNNERER